MSSREEQLGINLRYFRECDGLTLKEMAAKLHLSEAQLQALERGDPEATVPLRTLSTIYTVYGVNPEQLFLPLHAIIAERLKADKAPVVSFTL